jgi:hypothetical protein
LQKKLQHLGSNRDLLADKIRGSNEISMREIKFRAWEKTWKKNKDGEKEYLMAMTYNPLLYDLECSGEFSMCASAVTQNRPLVVTSKPAI